MRAWAMLAIMAVLAIGTVSATSDEDSIILPSPPETLRPHAPSHSAAEASIIVEELPLNLGPDQELIGRLRQPHEDDERNWVTPDMYAQESDAMSAPDAEQRYPPIHPVGPEKSEPAIVPVGPEKREPLRPVGPERPDPDIRPVGPEKEEPRIRPVGPERADPDIRPVGPERPDPDIHPVGPEKEEPHIHPVGPERPDPDIHPVGPERRDPDIRPVGPERRDPDIRPVGPEVPDIHPVGPEVPTEIVPVGPEEGVHNEFELDLSQLQQEAKEVKTQLLGGLHDILASLFGPSTPDPSATPSEPSEPEVRSEVFDGGVLTTSTQQLPDGGVVLVREFRAGGPLVTKSPEELLEEGEEAQPWDDDEEDAASLDAEDEEDAEGGEESLFSSSPFHGFFRRFFHAAPAPRHPLLRRGMFEQHDDGAFPQLKQQEHIRLGHGREHGHGHGHGRRGGGCRKGRGHGLAHHRSSPLFERLRHMLDAHLVPPPPPSAPFLFLDGPRHAHAHRRAHHGHHGGRRHRFSHRRERPRLDPAFSFGDEQDEAEFEGWPDTSLGEQAHSSAEWPARAEEASLEEEGQHPALLGGSAHDAPRHRHRASWAHRNRAWLWLGGGALLLLSLLSLLVCVHRACKRARSHRDGSGEPVVLFSAPHAPHFQRLSSSDAQLPDDAVPEHEIATPYARMHDQPMPSAQMQMAAPLLPAH